MLKAIVVNELTVSIAYCGTN